LWSMMIIKQADDTFIISDTLGNLGIWNLDYDGFVKYLNILKALRRKSGNDIRKYLLQESFGSPESDHQFLRAEFSDNEFLKSVLGEKLPLKCQFDIDIVLSKANYAEQGILNPPGISIDINKLCNYACKWCCVDIQEQPPHIGLSLETIEDKIIIPSVTAGNLVWFLVGGEPGLTPQKTKAIAERITSHTAEHSKETPLVALDTNGTSFLEYFEQYREAGINAVQFSLSSVSPEIDRYFRNTPAEVNTNELIKNAVRAAQSVNMHCGINMVCWKESEKLHNFDEIDGVIEFAFEQEIDFVRITPSVNVGASIEAGMDMGISDIAYISQIIQKKKELLSGKRSKTKIISIMPACRSRNDMLDDSPLICRACTCCIHIDHLGNLYPCAMMMPDFNFGNVTQKPLMELWRTSQEMNQWRNVEEICSECSNCSCRGYCIGRCPAYAWSKFGDIHLSEVPIRCPIKSRATVE